MVMAALLIRLGYKVGIAHCNFSLRGEESDGDEQLVVDFARKNGLPIHTIRFYTKSYAKEHVISTQMAARELRYSWFSELCREHGYTHIAIAHNRDDNVETFFVNLSRGTGIKGLCGIAVKSQNVVRPILFLSRKEIQSYAESGDVAYRNDSSNSSDYYARNRIRHNVVPEMRTVNPSFDRTMEENMCRMQQVDSLLSRLVGDFKEKYCAEVGNVFKVSIAALKAAPSPALYVFEILHPYGFTSGTVADVEHSLYEQAGKRFYSSTHMLVRDRENLLISPLEAVLEPAIIDIAEDVEAISAPLSIRLERLSRADLSDLKVPNTAALLDLDKLRFPIQLRRWQAGDTFVPFGMKGKKKLSDFMVDAKLSVLEKQHQWVLLSSGSIIWVVGLRTDDRYKVDDTTQRILRVTLFDI